MTETTPPAAKASRPSFAAIMPRLARALTHDSRPPLMALGFCALVIVCAVFGESIAPFAKDQAHFTSTLMPPAWTEQGNWPFILGTDHLGRDMLSRLIAGARISLMTAGAAIFVAGILGTLLGLIAGYVGGWLDIVISRLVDAFLALPFILMALALVAALGAGTANIILVMIVTNWARYARLVRSEVMSVKKLDYVTLARVAGVSHPLIILRHIIPNAMQSILVLALLDVGRSIILESSLSFLGLGIQPPDVSWGLMLADARSYLMFAWWTAAFPGLAIVATVMSFNSTGDWLKRRFDPRAFL
ncbi:ABC transporter permease subunit [bacterium]|nr:ABC transporter permease subunit [bacterium]